jgi:transposase
MHIVENVNGKYCYAKECVWDSEMKIYRNPGKCIGRLDVVGTQKEFVPNKYLTQILSQYKNDPSELSDYEMLVAHTAIEKYGDGIVATATDMTSTEDLPKTAHAIFYGPQLVFGTITERYKLQSLLENAFTQETAQDILSLAWYIASEGSALSNSDSWLEYFENPRGAPMSSQDITRLLDRMTTDDMMTFYKLWLSFNAAKQEEDKILYDLTSISYYGNSIDAAERGYNRDKENLRQVNLALLCQRQTGMPLLAWATNGSISDVVTLETTLEFVNKLGYKPGCLMMDRIFASMKNITYMLQKGYTFLQPTKGDAGWVHKLIDAGEDERASPDSMLKVDERTYYVSTVKCTFTVIKHLSGKKERSEETLVNVYKDGKPEVDISSNNDVKVISQHNCYFHALFCQDLVGNQRDRFMESLKVERERLLANENAEVKKGLAKYFIITKPKYARHRSVEYNLDAIKLHDNKYAGYLCFLTNDKTIKTAEDALAEYTTRDCIEKDFDEMKNDLDMRRLRVHSDGRMRSRLFIQFIAEIFMREIRVSLRESDDCKKMTRKQIFSHIKTIYKIKFKGKYRDVQPALSKAQRDILIAIGVDTR